MWRYLYTTPFRWEATLHFSFGKNRVKDICMTCTKGWRDTIEIRLLSNALPGLYSFLAERLLPPLASSLEVLDAPRAHFFECKYIAIVYYKNGSILLP